MDHSNGTPMPLFRVVSCAEIILGRDDPKFGTRILQCFIFAWETSFRRWKILTFCDITNSIL